MASGLGELCDFCILFELLVRGVVNSVVFPHCFYMCFVLIV